MVGTRTTQPTTRLIVLLVIALAPVVGVLSPISATPPASAEVDDAGRPNIIFITSDDQRMDEMWMLDNIQQRIAADGTTFERTYANFPLCCPARATFQTGQYAHNHGVLGNLSSTSPVGGYPAFDASSTIATWLDSSGYRTAFVGKYLNKYGVKPVTTPPGWDDWHGIVGGGNYFDTRIFENGKAFQYTGPYQTTLLGDIATNIIARDVPQADPLFLYTSFYAPHSGSPVEADDPRISTPAVAPGWKDHYSGIDFFRGPAYNEADVSDKPSYVRTKGRLASGMQAQLKESFQQRAESLESMDAAVGKMLDALAAAGELDNTLIIFTSDNGYMGGEHRIHAGKTVPYEPSTRVPLVIRGPGFPVNVTRRQLAGHIDLAPTMAEAADVAPTLTVDGVPLQPLATSPEEGTGRSLLLEAGPKTVGGPWFYRGVRTDEWVYIDYDTEAFVELYNMTTDPDQLQNLAYLPAYSDQRAAMASLLADLRDCQGLTCQK